MGCMEHHCVRCGYCIINNNTQKRDCPQCGYPMLRLCDEIIEEEDDSYSEESLKSELAEILLTAFAKELKISEEDLYEAIAKNRLHICDCKLIDQEDGDTILSIDYEYEKDL